MSVVIAYSRISMVTSIVAAALVASLATPARGAPPADCPTASTVLSEHKISQSWGGFDGELDDEDEFGYSVTGVGDVDGDGVVDVAVGVPGDDDGGTNRGAVWILFLNTDGTVKAEAKISDTLGGFTGVLDDGDYFGVSVTALGDFDGDGVVDIAAGADHDGDGGAQRGALWILFLNADGTVKGHQKISATAGGFTGDLEDFDRFGIAAGALGDLDGDGVNDLAVGAFHDNDQASNCGAVWILFLSPDGTVKSHQKISALWGGFGGSLDSDDNFGRGIAVLGDLDGDGVTDIAAGAEFDDDGASNCGAVWILFLNSDGTVKREQKISATAGGFGGELESDDWFGLGTVASSDLDNDGVAELVVGACQDDDGGIDRGAVWTLFLNPDGTVRAQQKISDTVGGFGGVLDDYDHFGFGVGTLGDFNGDGLSDVVVGAVHDCDGGTNRGAIWLIELDGCGSGPVILANPTSALLPSAGVLVGFSVVADGEAPLSYQWRRDGVDLVDGPKVSGATEAEVTVFAGFGEIGLYECVVSNAAGQAISAPAVLGIRTSCPGDINQDGVVDYDDIDLFVPLIGTICP